MLLSSSNSVGNLGRYSSDGAHPVAAELYNSDQIDSPQITDILSRSFVGDYELAELGHEKSSATNTRRLRNQGKHGIGFAAPASLFPILLLAFF
jgi:hypothetical protein